MDAVATAVEDLQFGLRVAADSYQAFAEHMDHRTAQSLVLELSTERRIDAQTLANAAQATQLRATQARLDRGSVGEFLGLGKSSPHDAASVMYRVQRAENSLGRLADQLASLVNVPQLAGALEEIGGRIALRKGNVRAMRRRVRGNAGLDGASPPSRRSVADGQTVDIWFGTNRLGNAKQGFGAVRANSVAYGRSSVFVPNNRRVGSLGSGPIGRIMNGDDRIKVNAIQTLGVSAFWGQMEAETAALAPDNRHGLVFLHGYKTRFEDAARRTAQLKVDLAHPGPAAFFSWPSLGSEIGYTGDEAAIEGSEHAIQQFLVDFAARSGANAVHVIAHSMGNRGLLRAMSAIANAAASGAPVRFGQIFLAAPDVDTQLFTHLASAYSKVAQRATLYVTDNDLAIGLSRRFHAFPRAGLTPPVIVLPGLDTIDASGVNMGLWGHGYAAEMRPVLADMYQLMRSGTPPRQRFGLREVAIAGLVHWKFSR